MNKKISIVNGKVQCEICGKWLQRVSSHVQAHNMNPDDYRAKFGYSLGTNLDAVPTKNGTRKYHGQWGYQKQVANKRLYQKKRKFEREFYDIGNINFEE